MSASGYSTQAPYGQPASGTPARRFGAVGATLAALAAVALIVAYTAVDWFDGNADSSFSTVHDVLHAAGASGNTESIARAYFGWLGWVLLVAAIVLALAANLPSSAAPALRIAGVVVGIGGAVVTLLALKLIDGPQGYRDYLKHADLGFYLAAGGFLLAAVASAIGPRRA